MFEGARRIMKIIFAVIALIGIYAAFDSSPDIKLVYETPFVGVKPIQINSDSCNSLDDAEESSYKTTAKGNDYKLILCFKASPSDAGEMVIPFENHVLEDVDYDPFSPEYAAKLAKASQNIAGKDFSAELFDDEPEQAGADFSAELFGAEQSQESKPQNGTGTKIMDVLSNKPLTAEQQQAIDDFDPDAYLVEKQAQQSQGQAPNIPENEIVWDEPSQPQQKKSNPQPVESAKNITYPNDDGFYLATAKPVYPTNQTWSGEGKYDDKVIQYTKSVISNFSVSAKDEQFVNKQYWPKKAKATLMPIGITVLSICGFWIFCWIIGWVVRGFTGIAMGQDRKS